MYNAFTLTEHCELEVAACDVGVDGQALHRPVPFALMMIATVTSLAVLLIVSITPLIAFSAVPPCLITTT